MYCRDWSLVKHLPDGLHIRPLWCRTWGCPECVEARVRDLKRYARAGNPRSFITLTVRGQDDNRQHIRAQELKDAWSKVRRLAMKVFRLKEFAFLAVFETTKAGEPHLHILARTRFIPQKWLSEQMNRLIGAPIVDIRRVSNARLAAWYVAKYISKAPARWTGCKRYWSSHDWATKEAAADTPIMDAGDGWTLMKKPQFVLVEGFLAQGFNVTFDAWRAIVHEGRWPP